MCLDTVRSGAGLRQKAVAFMVVSRPPLAGVARGGIGLAKSPL